MNDEQKVLSQTINKLTGMCKTKQFKWVVKTIIKLKDNIDDSKEKLKQ